MFLWLFILGLVIAAVMLLWMARYYALQRYALMAHRVCQACGYPRRGSVSPTCPECGSPWREEVAFRMPGLGVWTVTLIWRTLRWLLIYLLIPLVVLGLLIGLCSKIGWI